MIMKQDFHKKGQFRKRLQIKQLISNLIYTDISIQIYLQSVENVL